MKRMVGCVLAIALWPIAAQALEPVTSLRYCDQLTRVVYVEGLQLQMAGQEGLALVSHAEGSREAYTGLVSHYWGKDAAPDFVRALAKNELNYMLLFVSRLEIYRHGRLQQTLPRCAGDE